MRLSTKNEPVRLNCSSLPKVLPQRNEGNWELDMKNNTLYWSANQFRIYGYEPDEICLTNKFFILNTTHVSDVERITRIIDTAIKTTNEYHFKRRIVKKNGAVGFAETHAKIIRSEDGSPDKIVGYTLEVSGEISEGGTYDYNDPKFFHVLYNNYKKAISAEVYKMTYEKDLAKDLCQEIFLKAWHNMSKYDPKKGELYTWLINIAKNHCKDFLRSKNFRKKQVTCSLDIGATARLAEGSRPEVDSGIVSELLVQLSPDQQEIINLLFFQGYTQLEVAKAKDLPLGTVKTRSRTALKNLRQIALIISVPAIH